MRLFNTAAALACACLAAAPGAASGASSPDLWATVNRCDAAGASVGIRASMPGNGSSQRMYMRFSAQYRNAAGRYVETGSSSRWLQVGTARTRSVQSGYDFVFAVPARGTAFTFRGTVNYRWTARRGKRWRIVRTAKQVTRGAIEGVEGGVPAGASAPACVIGR